MYITLTEKEYNKLLRAAERNDRKDVNIKTLQEFCTKLANIALIVRDWDSDKTPRIHGCIITGHLKGYAVGYCGGCPSEELCPYERKRYGK